MKIISGKLKGRKINGYDILGTRPTMDRVKESIFAMIQDKISNAIVLDLFAGSGNLGIEAYSNGAKCVYFNDLNKKCVNLIRDNLNSFNGLDNNYVINLDYMECLNYLANKKVRFDLVFLDPPYKDMIIEKILNDLLLKKLLNNKALIVCETLNNLDYTSNNIVLYKERSYGDKKVFIYQYLE